MFQNANDSERSISSNQSESASGITLSNMTVEMTADERKRIKKYGADNLNITNMVLDGSLAVNDDKMIISPRKTMFFHEKPKFSVSLRDKVLMKQSEAEKANTLVNCSDENSLRLENTERNLLSSSIKTPHQSVNASTSRKHCITPLQSQRPAKIVYTSSKSSWSSKPLNLVSTAPKSTRRSSEILESLGLALDSPVSANKVAFTDECSMELAADFAKCPRLTVYEDSISEDTNSKPKVVKGMNNRHTVYAENIKVQDAAAKTSTSQVKSARKTLFEGSMEETNNAIQAPEKSFFDLSIEASKSLKLKDLPVVTSDKRETIYTEDISLTGNDHFVARNKRSKVDSNKTNRHTVYEHNIEVEVDEAAATTSISQVKSARKTLFEASIDETNNAIQAPEKSFFDLSIEATIPGARGMKDFPVNSNKRETVFSSDISLTCNDHLGTQNKSPGVNANEPNRQTIHEDSIDVDEPSTLRFRTSRKTFFDASIEQIHSAIPPPGKTVFDLSIEAAKNMKLKDLPIVDSDKRGTIFSSDISLTGNDHFVLQNKDSRVHASKANRHTVYGDNIEVDEAAAATSLHVKNSTFFEGSIEENNSAIKTPNEPSCWHIKSHSSSSDMEMDEPPLSASAADILPPENRTFTLKRIDSHRLTNVTDADFDSLIVDESDPCLNQSDSASQQMQMSFAGNITNYHQALQDFVNITIQSSPLNMSVDCRTPKRSDFRGRDFDSTADLSARLDNLVINLENKKKVKPRLAIDDFFENLNIQPVKIKRCPDLKNLEKLLKEGIKRTEQVAVQARAEAKKKYANFDLNLKEKLER